MEKIPVGATIAHAYSFAFGDFFKILGVVWLPWAILSAGSYFLISQVMKVFPAILHGDFAAILHITALLLPFYFIMLVFLCMQIAGITRLALGLNTGPVWAYFSLGKPVWRLVGAFFLVLLIMLGVEIGVGIASAIVGALVAIAASVAKLPILVTTLGLFLVQIVAGAAVLYFIIRLTFLLNPIIIAEDKIALGRAWSLGRGNFWRIVAIFLVAILLPVLAIEAVCFAGVFHGLPPTLPPHPTPEQINAFFTATAALVAAMIAQIKAYWYIFYPVFLVLTVLFYGLWVGAQSFAYRALVPEQDSAQAFS